MNKIEINNKVSEQKKYVLNKTDTVVSTIKIIVGVTIFLYCVSLLVPLVWSILTSFKDEFNYALDPFGIPTSWHFSNYTSVWKFLQITRPSDQGTLVYTIDILALNSLLRAALIPMITVMCQAMVTYVLAKYKFKGNSFIYMLNIVIMIIPIVGNLPSALQVSKAFGTYDNMFLNILTAPSNIFGLHFLILYGFYKGISWDFAEAAFIDGASHTQVFWSIMFPMVLPTCAVLYVLNFLGIWNDYTTPLIWLPSYPNLAYGLYIFQLNSTAGARGTNSPMVMAGFTIITIPTVLIYLLSQKLIMSKFTVGGLKG